MTSAEATTTVCSNADVATIAVAVQRVLADNKSGVLRQSLDGTKIDF